MLLFFSCNLQHLFVDGLQSDRATFIGIIVGSVAGAICLLAAAIVAVLVFRKVRFVADFASLTRLSEEKESRRNSSRSADEQRRASKQHADESAVTLQQVSLIHRWQPLTKQQQHFGEVPSLSSCQRLNLVSPTVDIPWEIPYKSLVFENLIGAGAYGKVNQSFLLPKALHPSTGLHWKVEKFSGSHQDSQRGTLGKATSRLQG